MPLLLPTLLQSFYVVTIAGILLANSIPPLRERFVAYGKTAPTTSASAEPASAFAKLLDFGAKLTVPHHYFTHFYVIAIASALFWGWQISTHGAIYRYASTLEGGPYARSVSTGMGIEQVVIAWILFLVQGIRRFYECVYVQKKGSGRMWFVHYIVGILFYTGMSVALWISGVDAIDKFVFTPKSLHALIGPPSLKTFVGALLFFFASGAQYDCHTHLASLVKYSLPDHPFFARLTCPHYFAECVIYAALSIVSAPKGQLVNSTVFVATVFVVVMLGVSAKVNKEWYRQKFGEDAVKGKWNMIPWVF